jgi:exosortase C (VPDSG-CTERM-specific)
VRAWLVGVILLVVAFAWPLYDLGRFALRSELYSHVILIPCVSFYFIWLKRHELRLQPATSRRNALVLLVIAFLGLAAYGALMLSYPTVTRDTRLSLSTAAFLAGFLGVCAWHFDAKTLRTYAFPLGFLLFMVPMPTSLMETIETVLQHGSASVADVMLKLADTPVLRQELLFHLPGITLQVAPECSGIRSSLALLITSVVAGYLFLNSPWKRTLLASMVLPLAILRNGFRVFVIGELCVEIGPHMIDSFLHRHGGPIFFALSLVPFALVLLLLTRQEQKQKARP